MNEDQVLAAFKAGVFSSEDVLAFYDRPVAEPERRSLSEGQQGLWLLHRLRPDSGAYNVPVCFRVLAPLDVARFRQAFELAAARHGLLGSAVVVEDGTPYLVARPDRLAGFRHERLSGQSAGERLAEVRRQAKIGFSLAEDPLARAHVFDADGEETLVLLVFHHLVFDGASTPIFLRDLISAYEALSTRTRWTCPARDRHDEFVRWEEGFLAGPEGEWHRAFWTKALHGPLLALNLGIERAPSPGTAPAADSVRLTLPGATSARVRQWCASSGIQPAGFFLGLYQLLLSRYSGVRDIVVGVPTMGRQDLAFADSVGYFVNMMPVRFSPREELPLTDYLRELSLVLADGLDHAAYPFPRMVRDLGVRTGPDTSPVFEVAYVFQNKRMMYVADEVLELGLARAMRFVEEISQEGEYKLELEVVENTDDYVAHLKYDAQRFAAPDVERFLRHYAQLADAVLAAPERALGEASHLSDEERRLLLTEWNDTKAPYSADQTLPDLLAAAVRHHPDRPAVTFGDRSMTYAEFGARTDQLADQLRRRGVTPDAVVGVCMERSLEMVVALWAVMKAGGAYLPLEPGYPAARLAYMLEDSGARLVLSQPHLDIEAPQILRLDGDGGVCGGDGAGGGDGLGAGAGVAGAGPRDLAYVIYTSGSTGRPKGVMVEHQAVVNRIEWMQGEYRLGGDDVVLQKTPFSFDVSVWEFVWPLVSGARLVVAEPEGHRDPGYLVSLIRRAGVTTLHFVPSMLRLVVEHEGWAGCGSVRRVFASGEALPGELAARHYARLSAPLFNLYGPTEAAIDVSHWACGAGEGPGTVPIGRPIQNIRLHVLDEGGRLAGVGCAGELYIAGAGLARGYLNNPGLTRERFVADPFGEPGARMYRTGDLVRRRSDGVLEFLGRIDGQVKIRGFRVELGEIEARLTQHPRVRACAVAAREDVLVGYVVLGPDDHALTLELHDELVGHLRETLPEHMVPNVFVRLDALPLSPNGKLDRKALPAPDTTASTLREHVAPRTAAEHTLLAVCADLLGLEASRISVRDNFFALGGHSLLIPKLTERLRDAGLHCDLLAVFAAASLAELAAVIGQVAEDEPFMIPRGGIPAGCAKITPDMLPLVTLTEDELATVVSAVPGGAANVQDVYPLAALQEGMLFHHLKEGGRDPYVLSGVFAFESRTCLDRFAEALQAVIDRHDVLRTAVLTEGLPQPVQVVARHAELTIDELKSPPPGASFQDEIQEILVQGQAMRLDRAPLMRLRAIQHQDSGQWHAVLDLHHLIDDATSLGFLFREVVAHLTGRQSELPEPAPYRDFIAHTAHRARTLETGAYFESLLADVTEPTILFGLSDVHGDGRRVLELRKPLDPELGRRVRASAMALKVSPATLFHAGWALVVAACAGRDDVVFGTVMSGRLQGPQGIERMLGNFINTLPLRVDLTGKDVRDLIGETDRALRELVRHEQTPLATIHRHSQVPSDTPLFSSIFNFRHLETGDRIDEAELEHVGITSLTGVVERSNYPVAMSVDDLGHSFSIAAQIDRAQDADLVITYLETAMAGLMDALAGEQSRLALEVPVLPGELRNQLLHADDRLPRATGADRCLHEWFEDTAAGAPEAVALSRDGVTVTYRDLNARANQLARHLRELGVGPDVLVALCLPRSERMIVALLAVLKAGGAYVPVDPASPADRLRHLLGDSAPRVLLADGPLPHGLDDPGVRVIDIRADEGRWRDLPGTDLPASVTNVASAHLAYVIYTSGSTGTPKGVMVEHRNVTRLFTATEPWFHFGSDDVWTLFHSVAFDFSVWEIWGALLHGGRLVIVPQAVTRSPKDVYRLLCESGVTILNQTPSAFRQLIAAQGEDPAPHRLRTVVFGGEALDVTSLRPWMRRAVNRRTGLVNMYGITETTVHVTYRPLTEADADAGVSPIGRSIPDLRTYVLDRHGRPAPAGASGELYVGGAGVARGYLNRPELTAERFLDDPFRPEADARMYRTGDLARVLRDGSLEYLGRNDDQVKVRGYRIELGEIEARLGAHPGIDEARVVVRDYGEDDKRLVSYLVPSARHARAVRELARIGRDEPEALERTYELPNGVTVFHHNRSETDFVYDEIFANLEYLRHGITVRDGDCIIDVGANIGLFTLFAGLRCPGARIYAFEPIPPVFDSLRRNVALHGLDAIVFDCGLAAEAKEETFTFYRHNTVISSSHTTVEQAHDMVRSYLRSQEELAQDGTVADDELVDAVVDSRLDSEQFTRKLRTLSEVIAEQGIERIDLLKIDVENAEYEVLKGIHWRDWPRIRQLVVELHDVDGRLEKVETLLRALDYTVVSEQDNRLLQNTPLFNVYAVRADDERPAGGRPEEPAVTTEPRWSGKAALLADVQATLGAALPEYMLPAAHVLLDALPLTLNGKLDHRALPAPESAQGHGERIVAPRTEAERTVAGAWAELLRVDASRLSVTSNFFLLGGDSLLVTRLVNRLKHQVGAELPIQAVFERPVLADMAAELERCTHAEPGADLSDVDRILRESLGVIESLSDEELDALESQN